jgi:adenylate cyclase, class 2
MIETLMSDADESDPMEIEVKFKVADHEPVRERLRQLGATRVSRVLETNHIFDDAARSLLARRRGLRIRSCRDDEDGSISGMLTYKGPPIASAAKQRVEIETSIGNSDAARRILEALGYVEVISFQKRRETWRWQDVLVELDELPQLGLYLEIEAPTLARLTEFEDHALFPTGEPISQTYVALVAQYCERTGQSPLSFTF